MRRGSTILMLRGPLYFSYMIFKLSLKVWTQQLHANGKKEKGIEDPFFLPLTELMCVHSLNVALINDYIQCSKSRGQTEYGNTIER